MRLEWISLGISLLIGVAAIVISWLIAKKYGDVAGTRAAIQYQEERDSQARRAALASLMLEVGRVAALAEHNADTDALRLGRPVVRIPVHTFETAFLGADSPLLQDPHSRGSTSEMLAPIWDYLTEASAINSLVDVYLALAPGTSSEERNRINRVLIQISERSTNIATLMGQIASMLTARYGQPPV